jgi:hypothetical protein
MPEIILEVRGLDEVIRRFGNRRNVTEPIAKALDKTVKLIQRGVTTYPPRPPESTYRRTGTLGRSFTTRVDRGRLEGRAGTRLAYAPYVIGDGTQAAWMRHWKTIGKVGEEALPRIEGFFVVAVDEIAQGLTED